MDITFFMMIKSNVNKIYNLKKKNRYTFCNTSINKSDKI